MSNHFDDVAEFHEKHGRPVGDTPHLLDDERFMHRVRLIHSELSELIEAHDDGDLVAFADALGDLDYVVSGTAVEAGIKLDGPGGVFDEVHRSNMTKDVDPENPGKIKKGESFDPPDIVKCLALQVLNGGNKQHGHQDPRIQAELDRIEREGMPHPL